MGLRIPSRKLRVTTQSPEVACEEIERFYRNYDSIRYVGDILVIRVRRAPTSAELDDLNQRFGHLVAAGRIDRVEPFRIERRDDDKLDLERIAFRSTKTWRSRS